jgi:hypothetical protein
MLQIDDTNAHFYAFRRIMMKNSLIAISLTVLAGCNGIETRPSNSSSNSYTISCHSINGTDEKCIKNAEAVCKDGYSIIEDESHKIEYVSNGDGFYMPPKYVLAVLCEPT